MALELCLGIWCISLEAFTLMKSLNIQTPNPQNGQTHSICQQFADELCEYVWPFCGIGA